MTTLGFQPKSRQDVDYKAGDLATRWTALVEYTTKYYNQIYPTGVPATDDAALAALPSTSGPVFSSDDIALLRNVMGDLNNAALTILGQRTQPAANNFLFNSNKIAQPGN